MMILAYAIFGAQRACTTATVLLTLGGYHTGDGTKLAKQNQHTHKNHLFPKRFYCLRKVTSPAFTPPACVQSASRASCPTAAPFLWSPSTSLLFVSLSPPYTTQFLLVARCACSCCSGLSRCIHKLDVDGMQAICSRDVHAFQTYLKSTGNT